MQLNKFKLVLSLVTLITSAELVNAQTTSDQSQINHFNELQGIVNNLSSKDPRQLCVVYDMDNTLVTADPRFGGDHWAVWNSSLDDKDPNKVTNWTGIKDFHALEGSIRLFVKYTPTESNTVATVNYIKDNLKHPSIIMTARTFDQYYSATAQELEVNQLNFQTNPIGTTATAAKALTLEPNKKNSGFKAYYQGVYYSAEDSKGVEIINLIKQQRKATGDNFLCQKVIFIDNSQNNINKIVADFNTVKPHNIHLTAVHYNFDEQFTNLTAGQIYFDWDVNESTSSAARFKAFIETQK